MYPTIGLRFDIQDSKYKNHESFEIKAYYCLGGHWSSAQEQRKFFDDYALENNFDPLIPDNWYKVAYYAILTKKVVYFLLLLSCHLLSSIMQHGQAILAKHKSIKRALMTIYPDIGLEEKKFKCKTIL